MVQRRRRKINSAYGTGGSYYPKEILVTVMREAIQQTLPQTSIFSFELKAVGKTMDWILFNVV
jgi:hypothetical protein